MSSASTQFEDERRLYEMIAKHHRDAEKREQIRMARADRPAGFAAFLASARSAIGEAVVLSGMHRAREMPAPVVADAERAEQAAGIPAGH